MAESVRILVVDDEPSIRALVHASLAMRRGRYEVIEAGDANEAVTLARSQSPDLVLLDVALPDHDGFWVCENLKQHPPTSGIPVIMLTAMGLQSDRERAAEVGADGYMVKPFSPRALLSLLEEQLPATDSGAQTT
jgi:CheY-like chemotaxis protein